jgi:spore maturation protein CgeB
MKGTLLIVGFNRPEALESSYARVFRQQGWSVHFWTPPEALQKFSRGRRLGRIFSTFVHVEAWSRKANLELLQLADQLQPDLILVIGTEGVRPGTLAQIKVRVPHSLLYCIYPDSPHNLDNERINCLPFFERVTTSSPAWVDAFERLGARRVHYLPFAADTHLHRPATQEARRDLQHDVVFIGTWRNEREEFLEQLADFDLCLWGSDYWQRRTRAGSPLRARWGGRSIMGEEFAAVSSASKIMLNIVDAATWPGPNMRTFEQAACRAFSLVTRSPAVLELFREGREIECFDTIAEAREKITYYLAHEEERKRIANAGYDLIVNGGHTYEARVEQVLSWAREDGLGLSR